MSGGKVLNQYIAAISAAGGALATGSVLGWTSLTSSKIKGGSYGFPVSEEQFSWVGSSMNLGAATACIPVGLIMNMLGRKLTMLILVIPFVLGWAFLLLAKHVIMLYAGRYILGICCGGFCVTSPMYIAEIASKEIRGTLCSFFQLFLTMGILIVYLLGWKLNVTVVNSVCALFPIIFGVIFFFMPESPTYLISKGKTAPAENSIKWLRGNNYDSGAEIAMLQAEDANIKARAGSAMEAMTRKVTLKALSMSLGLMFFQQMCGINAVIFYSGDIFKDANTGFDYAVGVVLVGVMQVPATFISTVVVDKIGRRLLLLISGSVMALCTISMGFYFFKQSRDVHSVTNISWLPFTCLCAFIIVFSLGYGPVPWIAVGELFAPDVKSVAGAITGTFNWILAFMITKTFVNFKQALGNGQTFWLFSCFTIVGLFFVIFWVIETKGKSLQEIQVELGKTD